jgi:hypothetical protein
MSGLKAAPDEHDSFDNRIARHVLEEDRRTNHADRVRAGAAIAE